MELVLIAVIIGGFAFLWDRIKGLERRIDRMELTGRVVPNQAEPPSGEVSADSQPDETSPDSDTASLAIPAARIAEPAAAALSEAEPEAAATMSAKAWDAGPEPASYQDEAATEKASGPRFQFDFEDIFGRRLPIWAGGIALAISGIFLVRYSIEAGLITPRVRVLLSVLFGLGLIAGAEAAYRLELKLRDERVRQALAGAGLATLFGSFYLAGSGYGLIGAGAAFVGLAAVTAAAIGLSHRFGLPCAIVGLVGGFAAPVLVDSDGANVPLLALYLALVTGGLAWTGQRQGRSWLGYAAMAAGLSWGFLMMLGGFGSTSDVLAFGGYLIVLGTVLPAFMGARSGPSLPQLAAGAIATLQMAYLVNDGGYSLLTWGLYLLIAGALAYLGWRNTALRAGSAVAAAVGLWLLAFWPSPETGNFAMIAAAMVAIFAGVPLALQWRGKATSLDVVQLSAMALFSGLVIYLKISSDWDGTIVKAELALVMAALAVFPAASFWLSWRKNAPLPRTETLAQLGSAGLLPMSAGNLLTDPWLAPVFAAVVALAFAFLLYLRDQLPLRIMAWAGGVFGIVILTASTGFTAELSLLWNSGDETDVIRAVVRWVAVLLPFAALAFVSRDYPSRPIADTVNALMRYGLLAQFIPGSWLAWVAAAGAIASFEWRRSGPAGWATLLAVAAAWTLEPLLHWFAATMVSLAGVEFLAGDAISSPDLLRLITPAALAAGLIAWRTESLDARVRLGLASIAGALSVIAVHSLYKGAWGIATYEQFVVLGLAERTIWQALLLASAVAIRNFASGQYARPASLALIGASLAHFVWFTLVLHNPLWASQEVGSLPILNWIAPAYGVAITGLVLARADIAERIPTGRVTADAAIMVLIAIMAVSILRQFFAGSLLNEVAIGQTESLLMSMLGIVLALGFLWWGSRQSKRSWRVGSLVLMLLAVLKVFLVDAAGLDGLLRIASFMALGFSLIGIGWFYTRQLKSERGAETSAEIA